MTRAPRRGLRTWAPVIVALAAGFLALRAPAPAGEVPPLPPEECLRMLRGARIAGMNGDAEGELATLRAARRAYPSELAPLHALLEYHRRHPLPESELGQLRAALAERLTDPERVPSLATLQRLARDPAIEEETLALILEILAGRPEAPGEEDLEALRFRAMLERRLGHLEAAAETMERLFERTETQAMPLLEVYASLERWSEAARVLESMLEAGSDHLRVRYFDALVKAGEIDKLLSEIDRWAGPDVGIVETTEGGRARRIDTVGGLLRRAAWALRDQGRDAEAERIFRRLLVIAPEDVEARAVLLHLYGSEDEQREHAAELARRWDAETDPQVLLDEGTHRLTTGDLEPALDLLLRAAPHFPNLEPAWYNLALAAYRSEEWETAEQAFSRASELNGSRAPSFFFRALALQKLGRCAEAVPALEKALELEPDQTLAHYHLYECHRDLGAPGKAAEHYRLYRAAGS